MKKKVHLLHGTQKRRARVCVRGHIEFGVNRTLGARMNTEKMKPSSTLKKNTSLLLELLSKKKRPTPGARRAAEAPDPA
jgi:hypothetical protein